MKTFELSLIGLCGLLVSANLFAQAKVHAEQVVRLDEKHKSCKLVGGMDVEKTRYTTAFYRRGDAALRERITKELKTQAAEKGGNAYFVSAQNLSEDSGSIEAFVYWCEGKEFAQEFAKVKTAQNEDKAKVEEPKAIEPEEAQEQPERKPMGRFGIQTKIGLVYVTGVGGGIEANYKLKDNWLVGAELLVASGSHTGDEKTYDDEEVDGGIWDVKKTPEMKFSLTELGLKGRWFFVPNHLSSLNALAGVSADFLTGKIGYRVETDYFFDDDTDKFYGRRYNATALTAQVGISNLWHFDFGMFVGADWITIVVPVATQFRLHGSDDDLDNEYIDDDDRSGLSSKGRKELRDILLVKSLGTIGWRF